MVSIKRVMNETPAPSYSIDELAALAELPRRTVRYYIQQGLVDRPIGEKRAAYYTASHHGSLSLGMGDMGGGGGGGWSGTSEGVGVKRGW